MALQKFLSFFLKQIEGIIFVYNVFDNNTFNKRTTSLVLNNRPRTRGGPT